jgi:programmed cell death protein 5
LEARNNQGRREEEEKAKEKVLKEQYLRIFLTSTARERLANVRMVRPDLAEQVENYILQLGLSGKLKSPVTDEELKTILSRFTPKQREIRFRFL